MASIIMGNTKEQNPFLTSRNLKLFGNIKFTTGMQARYEQVYGSMCTDCTKKAASLGKILLRGLWYNLNILQCKTVPYWAKKRKSHPKIIDHFSSMYSLRLSISNQYIKWTMESNCMDIQYILKSIHKQVVWKIVFIILE